MAKRRRQPDSDDVAAAMAELNTLFVDTSLDTHLVMVVSSSDTVADFKKKVALEHKHCFPEIGEIQVHTVKVKRRLNFYHLPDIMLVWSAFHGLKKSWFLSVDASSIHTQLIKGSLEVGTNSGVKIGTITNTDEELGINSAAKIGITNGDGDCRGLFSNANKNEIFRLSLSDGAAEKNDVSKMIVGTSSGLKIGITNTDEDCRGLTSDANKNEILPLPLTGGAAEKKDVSEMIVVPVSEAEKPAEKLMDSHGNIYSEERSMGTKSRPKKKRKLRHTKDESHNLEGSGVMFHSDGKDGKSTMPDSIVKDMNDQFDVEDKLVSEKASPPTTAEMTHLGSIVDSQNLKDSNRKEEVNGFKSTMDFELCQDVQAGHSGGVSIMVPDSSARLTNAGEDAKTSGSKRKKKKVRKTTAEIQDITNMAQIGNDERIKPTSETHKFDIMEEGKDLSLEQEGIMSSNNQLQDAENINFRIVNSQKLLNSDEMKEDNVVDRVDQDFPTMHSGGVNGFKSMMDFERCQDVQADHSVGVSIMEPDSSARPTNAGEDAKTSGSKRKKKKVRKTTAEIQDITNMAQIGNDERIKPTSETHKFDNMEEGKDLSLEQEGLMPSNSQLQDAEKRNFRIVNSQTLLNSDEMKEDNVVESKMNNGLDQDFPTMHSGGVIINMPDLSTRVMDVSGVVGDLNASGKKRRKKKVQKITVEVQDTRDVEQIGKGELKNPCAETKSEENLEEKGLSFKYDNEVLLTPNSNAPDHVDPNLAPKETSFWRDADADAVDPGIFSGTKTEKKKKKSGKKSVGTSIEKSGIMGIHNGIRGSSGKEESIRHNEGNDDQLKLLDSSNHDALEKAQDTNKNEADFVTKTQTEPTLEDVSVGNEKMAEKALVSGGNCHKDFPTGETENAILETNQDDKYTENTENKSRKTPKKRKKEKHTATDVHEKLPFMGKQVGTEALATETSIGSEQEGRHVGSSDVLPHKSEEIIVKNDELAKNSGNGNEEINFKQYFLLGEHQYKVNSRDQNKKNPSLDKSSSGRSETLPSNMRNQKLRLGMNGTNMMQLKAPKKKSLLDKSGAIFQDSSGESSGDENGTMHSDDSTVSPSDSSSMSGVSQNSTSRGSNDEEANSQRNMAKMDLSATTMDFILRNSKRFEKAKQVASQSESQPIDFVPDTQLT